jgi:hypothetical protein
VRDTGLVILAFFNAWGMKRNFLSLPFLLLGLFVSCESQPLVAPNPPRTLVAPIARAGNDTILYSPFNTYNLNGTASTDPDGKITSYAWKKIAGPSAINIDNYNKVKAFASNLAAMGSYLFELTVTDTDKLTSKDTVKITVAEPVCTSKNKELILENLVWVQPMFTEIDIYKLFSYLPPNSYIRNFYIKRDFSDKWELIVPFDLQSPQYGVLHEWLYGNETLVIMPGINKTDDTPDIKIEYCQ